MSTLFIAVQCFLCSTMQVKQQKKSSNKWVCVVCNEKQSVRRIHARSYLAKDVRSFVQRFNSSRCAHRSDGDDWISPRLEEFYGGSEGGGDDDRPKKRTDWTEYLDPKEDQESQDEEGGVFLTTEMPHEMFGSKVLKPKWSRKRQNETPQGSTGSSKSLKTSARQQPSKWSKYLEKEEEGKIEAKFERDEISLYGYRDLVDDSGQPSDLKVEEEVHPDFS